MAVGFGFLVWLILKLILTIKGAMLLKKILVLVTGFLVYLFTRIIGEHSSLYLGLELHIEPLLICIIGSFLVTNYLSLPERFHADCEGVGALCVILYFLP